LSSFIFFLNFFENFDICLEYEYKFLGLFYYFLFKVSFLVI